MATATLVKCQNGKHKKPPRGYCEKCRKTARQSQSARKYHRLKSNPTISTGPLPNQGLHQGTPKIAAQPWLDFFARLGMPLTSFHPSTQRAIYRAKNSGLMTVYLADELSIAFGKHPMEIWGDAWLTA